MGKYTDILNDYEDDKYNEFNKELEEELEEALEKADTYEEKAKILLEERISSLNGQLFLWVVGIIIIGNWLIDPPMLFRTTGHFGFILHPIQTLKELYFGWGVNQDSFLFSLTGLKHYFSAIPYVYYKFGFIKATFAYLTQCSPIWGFLPARFIIMGISDYIRNSAYAEQEELVKYLEKKDKEGKKNGSVGE